MTLFRLAAASLFALVLAASARAETIMHGGTVPAGEATPAGGSFSIRFPVEFKDVETRADDPKAPPRVMRLLSGLDADGVRFSAMETQTQGEQKPLDSFMDAAGKRPGAAISDVSREEKDGVETLSFSLAEPSEGSYFRLIRTKTTGYALVVQYPNALSAKAAGMKDEFFSSFKIARP